MDQAAGFYRYGLIESVILLLLMLLAFGAITVMARDRWLMLGPLESLLARLAAAVVLASVAVGGLSGVLLNLLQGPAFSDSSLSVTTSRNQAVLGIGLVGLVYYDRWMARRGARSGVGPGTAAVQEFGLVARVHSLTEARRLALFIAVGIGLHNFSEGLAIGQSAARNEENSNRSCACEAVTDTDVSGVT